MFDKDFGMNLNFSIIKQGDEYKIDIRYKDSENRESSSQAVTDSFENAFDACISEILESIIKQENINKKKEIIELQNEIDDCDREIIQLQQKISELKNKNKERKEKINKINIPFC